MVKMEKKNCINEFTNIAISDLIHSALRELKEYYKI
jgi:hypothetical protein